MNTENQPPTPDILDRATEELRNELIANAPSRRFVTATIAALYSHTNPPDAIRLQSRRQLMFRIARYSGLAAALLLLAIGASVVWLWDRGTTSAFAEVISNIKKATSVTYTARSRMNPAGGDERHYVKRFYAQGNATREEMVGTQADNSILKAEVGDSVTGEGLEIDFRKKTAQKHQLSKKDREHQNDFVEAISTLAATDAELIGEGILNGKKTDVYRLKKLNFPLGHGKVEEDETAKVWVDRESGLPVQILIKTFYADHKGTIEILRDEFMWNKPLDPDLFKLTIPAGFAVDVIDKNTTQ